MALHILELTLPLKNPVLIFSLILYITLLAPILLDRLKVPHLIGMIFAGAVVGPHGFNLMTRDSSIVLFGTVGLLYIMFLAGLEIDLADFRKNSGKSLVFGFFTFSIPMIMGIAAGIYVLGFSTITSVLLASMFASHTLIAYPIVSRFGVTRNRAVNIAVGGTMITDTLALVVLAAVVGMVTGKVTDGFWLKMAGSFIAFSAGVFLLFPLIGRWFFKRFENSILQYNFVLAMVFMGAFAAEAAGFEPIIGAFLAGLALNRLIPRTSPLMNRLEFVGNALFIPFFLIGVGMLVDYQAFFKDRETIIVAFTMTVIALASKYLAALVTQKIYHFSRDERRIIFGLSSAQAAATLAAVLVGYNIILETGADGVPVRLLGESILNGTILMILVTCTIASFSTQQGAESLALKESAERDSSAPVSEERILIPIGYADTAEELVHLSLTVKSKQNREGFFALTVIDHEGYDESAEKKAQKILDRAQHVAASADVELKKLLRYDLNLINGISGIVRQHKITDIILGLHHQKGISDTFLGNLTEGILSQCNTTTLIYKSTQPLATIKRDIVVVPEHAEREVGFPFWMTKIWNIGRNTGSKLVFFANEKTVKYLRELHRTYPVDAEFHPFNDWEDFLILAREVKNDDNLMIIMSRKNRLSYNRIMEKIPKYLNKYFKTNNFILVYPMQLGVADGEEFDLWNPSFLEPLMDNFARLDDLGRTVVKLFRQVDRGDRD
ncbi:MAG: cation:proton antiporter [Candidatus Rifleibacteriota bacterium]